MTPSQTSPFALLLAVGAAAALALPAHAGVPATLKIQQMTQTGAECNGGSFYPSLDAQARTLAFTSFCDLVPGQNTDGNAELFVEKTSGGGLRQLTHTTIGLGIGQPSMSPDGDLIAFSSSNDLVAGGNADGNFEIFVIHSDGTGLAQLTHTTGGRTQFGSQGNTEPVIDPSGRYIVFSSDRDLVAGGNADGNNDLFMMGIDGSGLRQLTATIGGWGIGGGGIDKAARRVVFDSDRDLVAGQNADLGYEIFAMNLDGSGLAQLTHSDTPADQYGSTGPRLTPDGQSIFFGSDQPLAGANPSGVYQVYEMDADGSAIVQITSCIGPSGAGPWSVADRGRAIGIESDCDLVPGANLDHDGEVFIETWKPGQFTPSRPGALPAAQFTKAASGAPRRVMPPRW